MDEQRADADITSTINIPAGETKRNAGVKVKANTSSCWPKGLSFSKMFSKQDNGCCYSTKNDTDNNGFVDAGELLTGTLNTTLDVAKRLGSIISIFDLIIMLLKVKGFNFTTSQLATYELLKVNLDGFTKIVTESKQLNAKLQDIANIETVSTEELANKDYAKSLAAKGVKAVDALIVFVNNVEKDNAVILADNNFDQDKVEKLRDGLNMVKSFAEVVERPTLEKIIINIKEQILPFAMDNSVIAKEKQEALLKYLDLIQSVSVKLQDNENIKPLLSEFISNKEEISAIKNADIITLDKTPSDVITKLAENKYKLIYLILKTVLNELTTKDMISAEEQKTMITGLALMNMLFTGAGYSLSASTDTANADVTTGTTLKLMPA